MSNFFNDIMYYHDNVMENKCNKLFSNTRDIGVVCEIKDDNKYEYHIDGLMSGFKFRNLKSAAINVRWNFLSSKLKNELNESNIKTTLEYLNKIKVYAEIEEDSEALLIMDSLIDIYTNKIDILKQLSQKDITINEKEVRKAAEVRIQFYYYGDNVFLILEPYLEKFYTEYYSENPYDGPLESCYESGKDTYPILGGFESGNNPSSIRVGFDSATKNINFNRYQFDKIGHTYQYLTNKYNHQCINFNNNNFLLFYNSDPNSLEDIKSLILGYEKSFEDQEKEERNILKSKNIFTILNDKFSSLDDKRISNKIEHLKYIIDDNKNLEQYINIEICALINNRFALLYKTKLELSNFIENIKSWYNDTSLDNLNKVLSLKFMLNNLTFNDKEKNKKNKWKTGVIKSFYFNQPLPNDLIFDCRKKLISNKYKKLSKEEKYYEKIYYALIAAQLKRKKILRKETNMLDEQNTNLFYLKGRMFAIFEKIEQLKNEKLNKQAQTISKSFEKYFKTPFISDELYSKYIRLYIRDLQRESDVAGLAHYYDNIIREIINKIDISNMSNKKITQEDQDMYFIGYYHQQQDLYKTKNNKNKEKESEKVND